MRDCSTYELTQLPSALLPDGKMGHSSQAIFPRFHLILALESLASSGNIFALTKDQFTPQVEVEMDSHFFGNRPTSCWSPHCQCHTHAFPSCCSPPPLSLSLPIQLANPPSSSILNVGGRIARQRSRNTFHALLPSSFLP